MTLPARIGATSFTLPNDLDVVATRYFAAPRQLVFDAWTKTEHTPNWLTGPEGWAMIVCEIDLRVGGVWRMTWRRADGSEIALVGTYLEIVPPERLVFTESWGPKWPETTNSIVLQDDGGRTRMTMTVTYPSKTARDAALETGGYNDLEQSFVRLDQHIESMR